jgi:cysteine synthase B
MAIGIFLAKIDLTPIFHWKVKDMIYNSVIDMIGNTPLLKIPAEIHGLKNIDVYAKLEYMNPYGSVKDRIAYGLMKDHIEEMKNTGKKPVIVSNANTAKAVCGIAHYVGLQPYIISNKMPYKEIKNQLTFLGGEIEELPATTQCPNPFDPNDMIQYAERKVAQNQDEYHLIDQFGDKNNPKIHFETTGKEIYDDLGDVDFFFAVLGTSGTTLGVGNYLREKNSETKVFGVITETGHSAPGGRSASEMWEVGIFNPNHYDEIITGTNQQATLGMRELNMKCGVMCGPTGGLGYHRMLEKLREIDPTLDSNKRHKAVFIACDRMEPYMDYVQNACPEIFEEKASHKLRVQTLPEIKVQGASSIYADELHELLNAEEPPLVIDTRGAFAYSIGHIKGSINIQDQLVEQMLDNGKPFPEDKKIVFACMKGDVSCRFAAFAKEIGYDAYSLSSGVAVYLNQFGGR